MVLCGFLVTPGLGAVGAVCINEALYDPAGSDAGLEFIELYNPGAESVDLGGWRLEAGNGARPEQWQPQWEGLPGERIAARGFFVVAGALFDGAADARAPLALQNGPDAVRLLSPAGRGDCLGWGALEFEEYYEGAPAPDVPGGWSLARIPDGADSDRNADDFEAQALPTPGRENAAEWRITLAEPECDPPLLDPGGGGVLTIGLTNHGLGAVDLSALSWSVESAGLEARVVRPEALWLQPGEAAEAAWELKAPAGTEGDSAWTADLAFALTGPAGEEASVPCRLRVGRGRVLISEIQYDPAGEEGEWVELWNASDSPVSLAGWELADASGCTTRLDGPEDLAARDHRIAAQKPDELLRACPGLSREMIAPRSGSWPTLNNGIDDDLGYADQIVLRDARGVPSDYVRYAPGDLDGNGIALERWIEGGRLVDPDALIPSPSASGSTPGFSSWPTEEAESHADLLRPDPYLFCPDRPGAERLCLIHIAHPPGTEAEVTADIYSLAGARVATLTAEARALGPLILAWDGCSSSGDPLPTGLYVVRAILRYTAGSGSSFHLAPVALVRRS